MSAAATAKVTASNVSTAIGSSGASLRIIRVIPGFERRSGAESRVLFFTDPLVSFPFPSPILPVSDRWLCGAVLSCADLNAQYPACLSAREKEEHDSQIDRKESRKETDDRIPARAGQSGDARQLAHPTLQRVELSQRPPPAADREHCGVEASRWKVRWSKSATLPSKATRAGPHCARRCARRTPRGFSF